MAYEALLVYLNHLVAHKERAVFSNTLIFLKPLTPFTVHDVSFGMPAHHANTKAAVVATSKATHPYSALKAPASNRLFLNQEASLVYCLPVVPIHA
jgi:hypothetical protein